MRWRAIILTIIALAVIGAGALVALRSRRTPAPAVQVPVPHDWALLPQGAREAAQAAAEDCRTNPDHPAAYARLGRIYHGNGQPALAIPAYERALALGISDPQTPYLLGLLYEDWGRTPQAMGALRLAIGRQEYAPAWYHLGRNLLDIGDTSRAIDAFTRAIELDPKDASFHTALGRALREAGRLDEAMAELRSALALDPKQPAANQLLGLALRAQGDEAGAAAHLAILNPTFTEVAHDPWLMEAQRQGASLEARLDRAQTLIAAGRLEPALRLLEDLAGQHPDRAEVFRRLGEAQARSGQLEQAAASYARALAIEPRDPSTRNALAENLMLRGDLEGAAAQVGQSLRDDPQDIDTLVTAAAIRLKRGAAQEAADQLLALTARRGDHAAANFWLAEALVELKRYPEAIAAYRRVLEIRPGFAPAQRRLQQLAAP